MVSKETILKALQKNQKQLTDLDAMYLTSLRIMDDREYHARRDSLELAFKKFKKDLEEKDRALDPFNADDRKILKRKKIAGFY